MANPFATSRWFHKIGHVTNTMVWRLVPTPSGLAVLTTRGRRSGKERVRAIRVMRDGEQLYGVAMLGQSCAWLHNIRANPEVRLKLGGRTYTAQARELSGPGEVVRAEAAYLPSAGWFDYVDYANLMWSFPTSAKVRRAHADWFARGVPVVFNGLS